MKRLDEIEARANAATEGPWEVEHHYARGVGRYVVSEVHPPVECEGNGAGGVYRSEDAEFIAHARTDVPALVSALRAVLEVHAETPYGCAVCEEQNWALPWPCPTVIAIRQHLGEDM